MKITQTDVTRTTVVMLVELKDSPHDVLDELLSQLAQLDCGDYQQGWTNFGGTGTKAVIVNRADDNGVGWIIDPENFHEDIITFLRGQRGVLHDEIDVMQANGEAGHDSCLNGYDWRLEFTVEQN